MLTQESTLCYICIHHTHHHIFGHHSERDGNCQKLQCLYGNKTVSNFFKKLERLLRDKWDVFHREPLQSSAIYQFALQAVTWTDISLTALITTSREKNLRENENSLNQHHKFK